MILNRRFSRPADRAQGITFVEIMIGIAIFGLIISMLLPVLNSYLNQMRRTKTETNLRFVKMEVEKFKMHTGQYPASVQDLMVRPSDQKLGARWAGPYVEDDRILIDGWNHDIMYQRTPGQQPPYQLYSWGRGGEGSPQDEWISGWTV
ncbi:MAG: General secretion pathway protein G [candidate division TM6 bacterium GW2011_GWE2_42_60]|nr:MAG: General secretion pathway protein G [candidate division TM6 bacterium GW2011_GWE2_42_60]HBY05418.1 hypothetical protein [Candidatus Dependentiae bacterium]